ncbi:MAG: hypothetical protein GY794_09635, partial [bacterium]|nr:hypothetical protein [bacterium]
MSSDTKKAACQRGIAVVFLVGLVLAAEILAHGADVPAGTKEAAEVQGPQNVLDLIMAGGYIMIPIGLCSILAMAV